VFGWGGSYNLIIFYFGFFIFFWFFFFFFFFFFFWRHKNNRVTEKVLDGEARLAVNLTSNSRGSLNNVAVPRVCAACWFWKHGLKYGHRR